MYLHLSGRDYRTDRYNVRSSRCCNLVGFLRLLQWGKVYYPFEILRACTQKQAQPAGYSPQVPYVNDRDGQINMSHSFTAYPVVSNLNAAVFADYSLELRA